MVGSKKLLVLLLAVSVLTVGGVPAAAAVDASSEIPLPHGESLDDSALQEIEGEGLAGAVIGGIGGVISGAVEYTVSHLWDRYVAGNSDAQWSNAELAKSVAVSATAGAVGGLIFGP